MIVPATFKQADRDVLVKSVTTSYQRGYYAPEDIAGLSAEALKTLAQMDPQEILDLAIGSLPWATRVAIQVGLTLDPTLKTKAHQACKEMKHDALLRRARAERVS